MTDLELYFQYKCEKGLEERGLDDKPEYQERLRYEIEIITSMGFCGYFLIVQDVLDWARINGIPVGPGRGSAAGSLVAYCLKITQLDPIRYGLIFERFLNPARVSMPDIDMDFCEIRRTEVIEYLSKKYGEKHVSHIGTYGSMKAKAAIRQMAKVLGYEYQLGDKLARLTLAPIAGKTQSLETCYQQVPELKQARQRTDKPEGKVLSWAERFEDRLRSFGTHASGIVIADKPIHYYTPLYPGKDNKPTTQLEMGNVEEIGLVKFDILGLRALTTIQRCLDSIEETTGHKIDILKIPVDDKETFQMLREGDIDGVFQLEGSSGIRDLIVKIRPESLEDLSATVAIYRPGPLGSTKLEQYLAARAGTAEPQYPVPELKPILESTAGWAIFQEQWMTIARDLAGYTNAEADNLRKIIGKKLPEKMAKEETKFKSGIAAKFGDKIANILWEELVGFALYSFNLAHAASYAYIGYQMAWLKTHYPIQFACACLVSDSDEPEKVIRYTNSCRDKGVPVLGPSVNESKEHFSLGKQAQHIRFGLFSIKHIGAAAAAIIEEREKNGPYQDIYDFTDRLPTQKVNRRQLETLVLTGAFDFMGQTRASLLYSIEQIYQYKKEVDSYLRKQETYMNRIGKYEERSKEIEAWDALSSEEQKQERAKGRKKPNRLKTPIKPESPVKPQINSQPEMNTIDILMHERELMGFYISGHPLDEIQKSANDQEISLVKEQGGHRQRVSIVAVPFSIKEITTKKTKAKMAYLTLEDKSGTMDAVVLPEVFAKHSSDIDEKIPARYKGEVDVVEVESASGDETIRITKLRITSVIPLLEVTDPAISPPTKLRITVPVHQLAATAAFLTKGGYASDEPHIEVDLCGNQGLLVGSTLYSGEREELDKFIEGIYGNIVES